MNMFKVEIKNAFKPFLIWTVILASMLSFFMSMFPSMSTSEMAELLQVKMDALPEGMIEAFGIDMVDFTNLLGFFSYSFQYILIALCVYSGVLAGNSLIKEESEGTIEFLYAQPISRNKIISTKLLAMFFITLLLNIALFFVTVAFFEAFKPDNYDYFMDLVMMFKVTFLLQLTFLSIGMLVSTLVKKVSTATLIMLGVVFLNYIIGVFSNVIEKIEYMGEISIINYFMPSNVLKNGAEVKHIVICVLVSIISLAFTYYRYNKKDFEI